jgi:hypothetical protein
VLERRIPYLLSMALIPSVFVPDFMSGNRRDGKRSE